MAGRALEIYAYIPENSLNLNRLWIVRFFVFEFFELKFENIFLQFFFHYLFY